jgi:hypothetical protein
MDGVTRWVRPQARLARGVVVAGAFVFLLLYRYRTPSVVLWVTVGVLAALAVIEFLVVEPRERRPSATRAVVPAPAQA